MSKYTTELRYIVEQTETDHAQDGTPTAGTYFLETYAALGMASFPIFDELYRYTLTDKIIEHFYFREIGFETVARFRFMMRRTLNEIMPYYNQLYDSIPLITDPLLTQDLSYSETWTRDLTRTGTEAAQDSTTRTDNLTHGSSDVETRTDNITKQDTGTVTTRDVGEDTPMGMLATATMEGPAASYASNIEWGSNTNTLTSTDTGTVTTETHTTDTDTGTQTTAYGHQGQSGTVDDEGGTRTHTTTGYTESQVRLVQEYRQAMLNVDMMVIDALDDLFMQIW